MSPPGMPPQLAARASALAAAAQLGSMRVSGVLLADAQLYATTNGGTFMQLDLQPARGLPYTARVHLGTDPSARTLAEAELRHLRAGVLVSVAGDGLEVRQDHGAAALRVVRARNAVSFHNPIDPPLPQERAHHVL